MSWKVHELISYREMKTLSTMFNLKISSYQPDNRRTVLCDRLLALLTGDKLDKPSWIIIGLAGLMLLGQLLRWYLFLR